VWKGENILPISLHAGRKEKRQWKCRKGGACIRGPDAFVRKHPIESYEPFCEGKKNHRRPGQRETLTRLQTYGGIEKKRV